MALSSELTPCSLCGEAIGMDADATVGFTDLASAIHSSPGSMTRWFIGRVSIAGKSAMSSWRLGIVRPNPCCHKSSL